MEIIGNFYHLKPGISELCGQETGDQIGPGGGGEEVAADRKQLNG